MLEPRAAHDPAGREPMGEPQVATTANSDASADPAGAGGGGVRSQAADSGSHASPAGAGGVHSQATPAADSGSHASPAGAGGVHSQATPAADSGSHAVPAGARGTPATAATTKAAASWTSFGGDAAHTRSSPHESVLSVSNVAALEHAFAIAAPGVTSTAAVHSGIAYWADWSGFVHATRLSDHSELWRHDSSAGGGGYIGSPAITDQTIYVANRNGLLSALERETGAPRWHTKLDAGPHTYIWGSPALAQRDGLLVIGLSNRGTVDNGAFIPEQTLRTFRGAVIGVDAMTGQQVWRTETSPEPSGSGVGVWSSAAIDSERHLAFIGTGNNFYPPVSPLSDSLLAIDYLTGSIVWSAQYTENDAWTAANIAEGQNADVAAAPNLFEQGGRALVGVGDKAGHYSVHDRVTGELIWQKTLLSGMYRGGVIAPAAYQNDTVYVISNEAYERGIAYALRAADGSEHWQHPLPHPVWGGPAIGNGVLYLTTSAGEVRALDAISGEQRWSTHLPGPAGGGISLACSTLLVGHGYQDFETLAEPLEGGLQGFTLPGAATCAP